MMTGIAFDIEKFNGKNDFRLSQMTKAKDDGGEGLYVRGRSGQRDMEHGTYSAWSKSQGRSNILRCYICQSEKHLKRDCLRECRVRGTGKVQVQMRDESSFVLDNVKYVPKLRQNLISLGTLEKEDFTVKMQSGNIKVIKGSLVVLSGTRRANCVYTLDGQAVTRKTLKGRKQLGEYQTGWKIKAGNVLDSCNQRSIQQCTKSGVAKHLGVAGIQQQNGLVKETNMTLLAKVHCFLIQSGLSKVLWAEDTTMSTYLVNKVVLYRNMCFNESGEYKKTFIGSGVGIGSVQVLQGVEFEVKPHYREDNNEAAFTVAEAEKIYAHESLTFNNTVACEVISKWKARLKDDMDAHSDVYVVSNGCRKCSGDSDGYYWEYTPATKGLLDKAKGNVLGMEIVRDQSGNTLRVSQSMFYNEKLLQALLEGHFILSLKGSLSGDYDVEKNGKWLCIYAVGGLEYQMVCTRLNIASEDVEAMMLHTMALSPTEAGYMALKEAAKELFWLKGLAIELGFKLKIVAGIATGALSKVIPGLRFQHRLKLLSIGIG
ncbi:hypothetical protein Tco_0189478 [Tanacetum coccineum]